MLRVAVVQGLGHGGREPLLHERDLLLLRELRRPSRRKGRAALPAAFEVAGAAVEAVFADGPGVLGLAASGAVPPQAAARTTARGRSEQKFIRQPYYAASRTTKQNGRTLRSTLATVTTIRVIAK